MRRLRPPETLPDVFNVQFDLHEENVVASLWSCRAFIQGGPKQLTGVQTLRAASSTWRQRALLSPMSCGRSFQTALVIQTLSWADRCSLTLGACNRNRRYLHHSAIFPASLALTSSRSRKPWTQLARPLTGASLTGTRHALTTFQCQCNLNQSHCVANISIPPYTFFRAAIEAPHAPLETHRRHHRRACHRTPARPRAGNQLRRWS